MNWPPSSLPATSRVQCSDTPQDAREASSSSGQPASSRTWSSTESPSRDCTWAWKTPESKHFHNRLCWTLFRPAASVYLHIHSDLRVLSCLQSELLTLIWPTVSCPVTSRVWVFWARRKSCILTLKEHTLFYWFNILKLNLTQFSSF